MCQHFYLPLEEGHCKIIIYLDPLTKNKMFITLLLQYTKNTYGFSLVNACLSTPNLVTHCRDVGVPYVLSSSKGCLGQISLLKHILLLTSFEFSCSMKAKGLSLPYCFTHS